MPQSQGVPNLGLCGSYGKDKADHDERPLLILWGMHFLFNQYFKKIIENKSSVNH